MSGYPTAADEASRFYGVPAQAASFALSSSDFAARDCVVVLVNVAAAAGDITVTIPGASEVMPGRVLLLSFSETNPGGRTTTITPASGTVVDLASLPLGDASATSVMLVSDGISNWWRAN